MIQSMIYLIIQDLKIRYLFVKNMIYSQVLMSGRIKFYYWRQVRINLNRNYIEK